MLFYLPLEPYKARYSFQWSAPVTGWLERRWIEAGIKYHRIDGESFSEGEIKTGCVLDAVGRSKFCFSQISQLLGLAEGGGISDDDILFLDDFWLPGFSALPYAFSLLGIKPKIYAFLHAQSVDEFDFCHPFRHWMRHFEKGMAEVMSGIFVCCQGLKDEVVLGGIAPKEKVVVTGHPFASDEVRERMPKEPLDRQDHVVWSSRWDKEKNPDFFLRVAKRVIKQLPWVQFIICTGSKSIRSNDASLLSLLEKARQDHPDNIILLENLTKEQYYQVLCRAKIQVNTAQQDWNPITLQEASVAGCYPIYPYFRSMPNCFQHQMEFLYGHLDEQHMTDKIISVLLKTDLWTPEAVKSREWLHTQFDTSWIRMLKVMGLTPAGINPEPVYGTQE